MNAATLEKTLNVRLPEATHAKLAQLTRRTKSFLAVEALDAYIDQQTWQIAEVRAGLEEASRGEFATDQEMQAIFCKICKLMDDTGFEKPRFDTCLHSPRQPARS
jgi:RHH-type transcriptional regulator, rel operon repressor / antitoxin RelB